MFQGTEIAAIFGELGISHAVWLPDSDLGKWESALEDSPQLRLLRVCREGEAWPLAAGLYLGGKSPIVMMQTTGLFESGDALRHVLFDLQLPLFALIGARNWLVPDSPDSARRFTQPILDAWQVDCLWVQQAGDKPKLAEFYRRQQQAARPGFAILAEGRGG